MESRRNTKPQNELTRLSKRLQPDLPLFEMSFYTAAWIMGVCYSLYHVFIASRVYYEDLVIRDLEVGWFGSSPRKDVSDTEWHEFSAVFLQSIPWLFIHFIGSEALRKTNKSLIPVFWMLLGLIYIDKLLGHKGLVYLLFQPVVLFLVSKLGSSKLLYLAALCYIAGDGYWPIKELLDQAFEPHEYQLRYFAKVTNSWMNARAVSFCLDHIWGDVKSSGFFTDLCYLLAHCFYLPTCVSGPIINYIDFQEGLNGDPKPCTRDRIFDFLKLLARYSFWFAINELLLHAFYFSALQYDYKIMTSVNLWTLCGIGYAMGQFFYMKYVVFYGMPRVFLLEDGIAAPATPKCIGRIHLYSDMWRYFDEGLYKFLRRYFYVPLVEMGVSNQRNPSIMIKLLASSFTFAFVYIWHGTHDYVRIWTFFNFLGITLEAAARELQNRSWYARLEQRIFTMQGRRRWYSVLGAPLFLMSIVSNFFFFMGKDIGWLYFDKAFNSWPTGTPTILFFMYCGAQTSYEITNWEIRARLTQDKKK